MTFASVTGAVTMALAMALAIGRSPAEGTENAPSRPLPIHADPPALEAAILDTTRAFLRADLVGARAALDRVEHACRRLAPDEAAAYPSDVVLFDGAFHKALDVAREYSARGLDDRAFDQLRWIQKSCRTCHEIARKEGLPGTPIPTVPAVPQQGAPAPE